MKMKQLFRHTTTLIRTALLLGALAFVTPQQTQAQNSGQQAGLPDAFQTMDPTDVIGDGQYYYIQFYDGNDRSYLSDEGNGKDLRSKDYLPFAKNLQWTLEATGTDGQFYLKSRSGHYVYLDGSNYKGGSINKSALTATLRTNSTSGGGYDISTVSAPSYAMGRKGSSGIAPPWTNITSINHNNHRIAYTRLRIAKLKDNIAHIIYWQEPVYDKNGNVVDRNADTRGGVEGFAKRHYLTYSGTDASNNDGTFRTSTVSSRSSILTTYANWYLATAAAYHKDGLWTLEESDVDGEFFIKKYGTQDYLNGVRRSGDGFYLSDLGTKDDVYKLEQPKVNRYTRIQHLDESTEPLTSSMFKTWNGYGGDATSTGDATVDFNVGNGTINAGGMVAGTGGVDYKTYADLSGYSKMTISGTPGMQLRALMSRQESNTGPYVEKDVTIGSDGKAVVDLTNLELQETNDPNQQFATQNGTATVKMTYVNYDAPTTPYNEIAAGESARSGYNNISDGSVGFGDTSWGVNYITYLQVDARAIPGKITKVTLKADVSGSTDGKRTTGWGVGYNNSTWSATMTYNNADKSITNLSDGLQWTSTTSATTFENKTFDITGAFTVDALNKVATILVYETAAAGGYIKNPTVEVEYTPYVSNVPITFAHLNAIKAGWGSPSGTISSITLSKDNADQRYLRHAHGDGWQVLQWSGNDDDYWYAGFYPVEVVDKDEFYQVLLKYGDNMVGVESDQTAALKPYNDFNPDLWDLEQVDDYGHFRFRWWNGTCYNGIGNALTTADPTGNDIGIYSNSDINNMFTVQWLPKTEKRIPYEVTHKESNVRLYYTYNPTTPARQKVYGQQGLITDADSEWWDRDKGTQKVNEFIITHYVKKGETVEFGLPTVLTDHNDHRLFQRWYNYDDDRDLTGLKNHFRLKAGGVEVMSYLYNNGIVTGEKLDWGTIFPGARTFELNYLTFNNCDGQPFTLAADVSRYSDFDYANKSSHLEGNLQEPSLTMRYIYQMRDAKVIAADLMDNTEGSDNWLETKDFHFPATRVAYETSKPAAYQGEFIGIRHQFKDYWVFKTTDQNAWTDNNLESAVTNSTSGHIEVVVEANGTGITLGGKDNKGYYLYDEGKNDYASSKAYGDSRFVAFKYPASGTVLATGEDHPAYVKVYFNYNNTRYQIAKFKIVFEENTSTLPWTSVNNSAQVKGTDRDPKNLEKKAGRPIAKVSFDYPTGATFKNSSAYNIHNNGVMEGLWGEIANSSPLPLTFEKTNYGFDGDNPSWGSYALVTTMPTRYGNYKTTSPANDATYGYNIAPDKGMQSAFLYIDASEQPGEICAIPFTGEFCSGDKLMCTGWISGSNRMFNDNRCPGSVILTVKGETFDGEEVPIYRFCPGQCYELDNGTGIDGVTGSDHVVWQQFYFEFEVQRKYVRQWVEVNNNCVSSTGGDFMLDNIEVYAMVPSVEAEMNTPLCIDHEASEMQLLKFTVGFDKLLYNSNINEATSGDVTPHYLGLAFLEKNVFLSTLKEQLHFAGTLSELETAIANGEYQNILNDNHAAYVAAFDAALLGDNRVWNSWELTSNEGAGLLNYRWYDNFSQMDTYSFAKAVNKENSIFGYTDPDTGERLLVMNGNYPKLPWKANTDYYIISSVSGISTDIYSDFNICSECSKATPFQLAPPYDIYTMEATYSTGEMVVCEGTIPTLVTDLKGYDFNGVEVSMNDINYDWWLGDPHAATPLVATLANYHEQHLGSVWLDQALSYLRSYYPEANTLEGLNPKERLTADMLTYLQDLVDKGQLVLHQKSISVPATPTSTDDPYFYLVACPIHDASFDQSLKTGDGKLVAFFCDEPQGLRMKVSEKAPALKTGFVPDENGFTMYDYSSVGDAVLSIRLAKREQFETVKHGLATEAAITDPAAADEDLHFLWLPLRDASVQTEASDRVIRKSEDENIYLASTNDPTWDKAIYQSMKKGALPIVGKIVQLTAIDKDKSSSGTENDNNRLCVYFTENFDVREGYNYALSLPFQESPGVNTCDGTILINLKIVPDYEVWTGGAGSTDWNNDENWRRADGNLATPTTESTDGSKRNNNELLRTDDLPDKSPLQDYVTNYGNYRTPKDRLLRKGFAPLYCTHILLKNNEWGDAPQLYDALNGEAQLTNAPFPNLSEAVTESYTVTSYGIDQRFTSIADLSGQSFAIVNESEGKAIYGTTAQNLGYDTYQNAYQSTNSAYYFKLEDGPDGSYLLRAYTPSGAPYDFYAWNNWHYKNYLNSQPATGTVSFILGLADRNGQDGANLALWTLESDGNGKFALKNVGTGSYLKDNGVANNADPTFFTFCTLKDTEIQTRTVSQNNILKFDLQARLYDIWSDTYGAVPNKGRTGDLIAEMYQINSCDEIAFQPGAEMLNAHLLNYNNAWVEYQLDNERWYLLGSPLQGTISGEWYAPTGTAQQKTTYYEPVTFGEGYDRYSPAIYQRSWDKAKAVLYEIGAEYATTDDDQTQNLGSSLQGAWSGTDWNDATSADRYLDRLGYKPMGGKKVNVAMKGIWSNTYNDATVDYAKGGFSVMVKNALKDNDQSGGHAIIRLPKEETMYDYYGFDRDGEDNPASYEDIGTNTPLSGVQTALNRALNRGRLKTDLLLPLVDGNVVANTFQQIQRTETAPSRYGDARTYTRVPWTVGENALPMTAENNNALRSFTEGVPAGASNMGYYLVENPFPCGLDMEKFFEENDGLEQKYWILTSSGQHLVQKVADNDWISPEEVVTGEEPNTETTYQFSAANGVLAPGQGFFVQAKTAGESTDITFTADMQAQTRYGEPDAGEEFEIVVGTKQVMESVQAVDEEGNGLVDENGDDIMVEVPKVDDQGNYVVDDIKETVTIYKYKQKTGAGYEFPLKARTRSAGSDLSGMVITARRNGLQNSALVMLRESASNDFLPSEDTETFISMDELKQVPMVYTLCGRLATTINSIHDFRCLPLGVESASEAPCSLTFEGVETLGDSVAIYDAVEQTLTSLESGHQLTVSGQTQHRYYLVRGLSLEEAAVESNVQIFGRQRQVTVVASTEEPIVSIRCTDAAGRLVYTAEPQVSTFSFALPTSGVYIIEAKTEKDRATRKIVAP